ncbi:MAG: NHL repeat-containing protein [Rubricoccaceae bacterium]
MLARLADARALAATPGGLLAVADAGEGRVRLFGPDGTPRGVLGGTGREGEALLEPSAIDLTNGLDVFVADAAGGRVLRFTAEGALAETIHLETGVPWRTPVPEAPVARPVGVAAGPGGVLFVAEAARRGVRRLDRARRVEAVVGGDEAGEAALQRPVALALGPGGALFVADAGRGAVLRFDALGQPAGVLALPGALRSLAMDRAGGRLLVTTTDAVSGFALGDAAADPHRAATPAFRVTPALGEPLVGAALVAERLLVLTPSRLVDLGPLPAAPAP